MHIGENTMKISELLEARDTHCSDKCCGSDVKAEDCKCPPTCKHCNCNAKNKIDEFNLIRRGLAALGFDGKSRLNTQKADTNTIARRAQELKIQRMPVPQVVQTLRDEFGISDRQAKDAIALAGSGVDISETTSDLLDPLKGAYSELFGKQPKEEAQEKIALDQAMEKYKNNPKGLKAWLMKNRNILVWLNTSGGQMMDIVKQRIRETTTAGGIASSMGVMDAVPAESIQEDDNPAPNKIKPIKMSQPPKAPDATIPRSRDGHTKSDGTMYKQDKYNDNIMHVSNGGGTYTFDGSRLIRWKTPKINGYSQIHDFIKNTITVDANTSVTTKNPDFGQKPADAEILKKNGIDLSTSTTVVDTNAVYDLKGNLIDKGEMGIRSGGLGVSQSDKNFKINYNVSPNLSMHIVADRKPVTPKVKQSMDAIVNSPNKDGTASDLIKIPMIAKKAGAKVIFKNSQGQSVPYDQAIAMMKKGKP